jgi:hypothetical protein
VQKVLNGTLVAPCRRRRQRCEQEFYFAGGILLTEFRLTRRGVEAGVDVDRLVRVGTADGLLR